MDSMISANTRMVISRMRGERQRQEDSSAGRGEGNRILAVPCGSKIGSKTGAC